MDRESSYMLQYRIDVPINNVCQPIIVRFVCLQFPIHIWPRVHVYHLLVCLSNHFQQICDTNVNMEYTTNGANIYTHTL